MKQEIKGWKGKYKVYVHINKINNKNLYRTNL